VTIHQLTQWSYTQATRNVFDSLPALAIAIFQNTALGGGMQLQFRSW
jgi:hypothetical protein